MFAFDLRGRLRTNLKLHEHTDEPVVYGHESVTAALVQVNAALLEVDQEEAAHAFIAVVQLRSPHLGLVLERVPQATIELVVGVEPLHQLTDVAEG